MNNNDISSHGSTQEEVLPEFVSYLADRLGLDHASALHTVGEWLVRYEPITRQVIDTLEPRSAVSNTFGSNASEL